MSETRILSIVPYKVLPAKVGGEKFIHLFNKYVGKECTLTALGVKSNDIGYAVNYEMLPVFLNSRIRYFNPLMYFLVRRELKRTNSTHLLIEHPYFGWLAWLIKISTKVVWVVHSHNIEAQRSKSIGRWWWKALEWYEKWVYKKADIIFFISDHDRNYAIKHYGTAPSKSFTIPYGIENAGLPEDEKNCREEICKLHGILPSDKIILFNGALYLHSNYDAVRVILDEINPNLLISGLNYKILICGKGLPESFQALRNYKDKNVIYAGFVDDISKYFKAADIFLNPILTGGGVKTKAIEAIGYNCTVVSTTFGAIGLDLDSCRNKLYTVDDGNWKDFTNMTLQCLQNPNTTIPEFYEYYYWDSIAKKVGAILGNSTVK